MKMMSVMCNEKEWTAYIGVVLKSGIRVIELVATRVGRDVIGDESAPSPTLPKAVDEQSVECAVVLTQLWQSLDDEGIADKPPLMKVMKQSIMWNRCKEVFVMLLMKWEGWPMSTLNQLLQWSILVTRLLSYQSSWCITMRRLGMSRPRDQMAII
jgi:hypothetical protein